MNKIPESFTKDGMRRTLVRRTPKAALYRHHFLKYPCFEVMVIRTRNERKIGESTIPAGEFLPSSEEWGHFGWTYSGNHALERGEAKMAEIG